MRSYTVKEVATLLNTKPETVRRWIRSGKLAATQKSKKQGNVITEPKLKEFLEGTTKYALPLISLSPSVGLAYSTLALLGGMVAKQYVKNEMAKNSELDPTTILYLLESEVRQKKDQIEKKEETINQINEEIGELKASVEELQMVIDSLSDIQDTRVLEKGDNESVE